MTPNPTTPQQCVRRFGFGLAFLLVSLWAGLLASNAQAQSAPVLLWSTNIGAQLFAVDSQTNLYANDGGKVILLNGLGVPLGTNQICPLRGIAQRDTEGNYYFAGSFTPPQDFGGVVLTTGSAFLAKYTPTGALLWAVPLFLPNGFGTTYVQDLRLDPAGYAYVGYWVGFTSYLRSGPVIMRIDPSGSTAWVFGADSSNNSGSCQVRFGALTRTNGYALCLPRAGPMGSIDFKRFDGNGNDTILASWGGLELDSARPIDNVSGQVYIIEDTSGWQTFELRKRDPFGALLWSKPLAAGVTIGTDLDGGVHVSCRPSKLSRYDYDGALVWTISLPAYCREMLSDEQGNRFVWLEDGTLARLSNEIPAAPAITSQLQGLTTFSGSNVSLAIGVTGSGPLRYFWRFNGNPLAAGSSPALDITNVAPAQGGLYSVIVSNFVGSVTSAPALLRVKSVAFYLGDQLLTNGTYTFASPPTLAVRSAFPGGSSFYSLDGSTPSFASTYYTGPFTVPHSAMARAIGYSADFLEWEEADAVSLVVPQRHTLTVSVPGGGSVNLKPPGGIYDSTEVVTATAVPASGYSFLYWAGDAEGTNLTASVSMERDKVIRAVFGTPLFFTIAGPGHLQVEPLGIVFPYGTTARLTAVPQPGNYFGAWGNAASGNVNPLYFTITNPAPTVSSIFGPTPAGQVALTVIISGQGKVGVSPRANAYLSGASVTLTATADPGQAFLGWSGDATGAQNPLTIIMNQSRTINATFSSRPKLSVSQPGLEGFTADGFRLSLTSAPMSSWQIFGSTNLSTWDLLGTVTNAWGEAQFTDPGARELPRRFYRASPAP